MATAYSYQPEKKIFKKLIEERKYCLDSVFWTNVIGERVSSPQAEALKYHYCLIVSLTFTDLQVPNVDLVSIFFSKRFIKANVFVKYLLSQPKLYPWAQQRGRFCP